MDERLGRGTFAFLGRFPIQTCPTLHWPHKQRWMRVFRRFCEFQLCIRWGRVGKEGQLQENFEKEALFYEGTQKITEKYKYCFTVPRTFVHDCITLCFFKELLQENEENCGKHILVVSYREIVNYSPPPTPLPVHPPPHRHLFRLFEIQSNQGIFFFPGSVERKPLLLGWSFPQSPLQSLFYFREICQIQVTSQYSPTCFSNYGNQESMTMGSCGNTFLRESMVIDDQDKHEGISFEVCLDKL